MVNGTIENLGAEVQKEVIRMSTEGMGGQAISDRLLGEKEVQVSPEEVNSFLKRQQNRSAALLKESKSFQEELIRYKFDTVDKLNQLVEEMWSFFMDLKKNPELQTKTFFCEKCQAKNTVVVQNYSNFIKTADSILAQLKHADAVLGRMKNKNLNITYNFVDLSKKLSMLTPKFLDNLEKKDMIKVNKKKLKVYNLN
jgi:hypothetical protein